ncbi:helix-turn-helix domain-containing protein [Pseudogemmobacter humi]|uniref:Helix-turn-helix domain protein n=1 Tax=Pseudogemmobacter humi TaxID=2483812 RepID=A0A3P5XGC8_9RHOB|nr:helix-turn-helix transcriptional regulator [Pseudogemmobacter humi]VDC33918.1 Helix-turn-helix domain protein [Pseudogemmobacter humi]
MRLESADQLGGLIRQRREALKLRQGELASISGVDQGNLSKIERGCARARFETYLRLCSALGIDLMAEAR